MKNKVYGVFFVVVTFFCASSAWAQKVYRPLPKNAEVISSVQTEFFATGGNGFAAVTESIKQQAYIKLKEIASKKYQGNIDVFDITVALIKWRSALVTAGADYSADGKVVLLGGGSVANVGTGVEGALTRAVNDVSKDFTSNARIAIVQITAPDRSTRDYMIGEIEYILQKQGYYLVDRAQLDKIFEEQQFGATSDVDDNTAARMGKVAGASIVITGRIDGEGNLRRLRLRALNTETARVVGAASERL